MKGSFGPQVSWTHILLLEHPLVNGIDGKEYLFWICNKLSSIGNELIMDTHVSLMRAFEFIAMSLVCSLNPNEGF